MLSVRKVRTFDIVPGMSPGERYTFLIRMSSMVGAKMGVAESLFMPSAGVGPIGWA